MASDSNDVVIIGGGIAGISTAYFLNQHGVNCTVVERDSVGSHASGFAYGGLSPLGGAGIPGPIFPVALEGMRLHREFAELLPRETGVDTEYRERASLSLAFTDEEVLNAKAGLAWKQRQSGYSAQWLDAKAAKSIEPRISDDVVGAVYTEGGGEVEPYKFILALTQYAETQGTTIRHGTLTGLKRDGARVTSVLLESGEIPCDRVVLALGPWSGGAADWLGVPIGVRPLKGQILRLQAPGAPIECSVGWADNYATTKKDGLLWTGTTEEAAGFDENPTSHARDQIMALLLKMLPSLADAQLVQQTACLRPLPSDDMLVIGEIPGWEGVYMVTGAGRKGIILGPAMGRITADLIVNGKSDIPIKAFDPGRFQA